MCYKSFDNKNFEVHNIHHHIIETLESDGGVVYKIIEHCEDMIIAFFIHYYITLSMVKSYPLIFSVSLRFWMISLPLASI